MKAVLWTEGMQAPLLLIGSIVILLVGLNQIGGLDLPTSGELRYRASDTA